MLAQSGDFEVSAGKRDRAGECLPLREDRLAIRGDEIGEALHVSILLTRRYVRKTPALKSRDAYGWAAMRICDLHAFIFHESFLTFFELPL